MDVPVKSSDANEGLMFEANTPNIPEVNTKVYLVFRPELKDAEKKPSNVPAILDDAPASAPKNEMEEENDQ